MKATVNGIKIYYNVIGNGPPLLLLHANSQNHRIFNVVSKQLKEKFTVYMPDLRDHGLSTRVKYLSYDDMTADMAEFIKKVIGQKTAVYGISDGGIIALLLAADYPETVSKVIASGANTSPDGVRDENIRLYRFLDRFYPSYKMKMLLTQPHITAERLAKISVPVHILAGSDDVIKESDTRFIADSIPSATLEILQGETHTSYVSHSKKLYPIIMKYLKDKR